MEALDEDQARDILNDRHGQGHDEKQDAIEDDAMPQSAEDSLLNAGQGKERDGTRPVQRQIRPDQKAGVEPLPVRVCPGDKAPEQQLQPPSGDGAEEEQVK